MIQRDEELKKWVMENTLLPHTDSFPAHIYSAINKITNICDNGKMKKFKSITEGFAFCGPTNKCECAKKSVSEKVSLTKGNRTKDQIVVENKKRNKTNLEKYGVVNAGQTEIAKTNHAALYSDVIKVSSITERIKKTKEKNHGDSRYNNRSKCISTTMEKYGVKNTWSLTEDKQNPMLQIMKDKSEFSKYYPKYTPTEIAKLFDVHLHTVYRYLKTHEFREPYKSTFEQEIVFFLNSLGITNIVTNNRKLIGKEIDIYLPEYNLAIEYNGIYWHHDQIPHITKTYHYDKFRLCEDKGITLFTIFGNSWEEKKEIWKNKIRRKVSQSTRKVFARKTKVVELAAADTRTILDENHIQGYCTSVYSYGLMYKNDIVAVMTFSPKRAGIGKKREPNSYELVRYVTSCNVVGGASKLLNHFKKTLLPSVVYSYSDNQYSTGEMYKLLGFELENENKAGYWYFDPIKKKVYHRFNFTKGKLVKQGFDAGLSEYEIMKSLGYLRIWDCGSRTWIYTIN